MVCGQETKDDISSILALEQAPHAVDEWADSTYTCTYHLADGLLVISVKESPAPAAARKYFDALQGKLEAAPIKGLANLGFPAAQTPDGSVVFLKDSSTLHVNATGLPPAVGPRRWLPPTSPTRWPPPSWPAGKNTTEPWIPHSSVSAARLSSCCSAAWSWRAAEP